MDPTSSLSIQEEWNKLKLAHQRLSLQQERLQLDQAMFKEEKRNFKRSQKLAQKAIAASASTSDDQSINSMNSQLAMPQLAPTNSSTSTHDAEAVEKLRDQLILAQEQLQSKDKELKTLHSSIQQEGHDLEGQLQATQRSLASMLVERDALRLERDALEDKLESLSQQNAGDSSLKGCHKCGDRQIELQQLQDDLQHMKLAYAQSQARHAQQKRDYRFQQEQTSQEQHSRTVELEELVKELQQEKEGLETELQKVREESSSADKDNGDYWKATAERLRAQFDQQSQQLEDYKLLLPRNKSLLEQATAKKDRLLTKISELEDRLDDSDEELKKLKASEAELEQQNQTLQKERDELLEGREQQMSDRGANVSVESPENLVEQFSSKSKGVTLSVTDVVIPLDESTSKKAAQDGGKHVVEWEWTGPTGLFGLYTGWLDLTGNPNGHGTLRIEDGSIYDGEWRRGLREGKPNKISKETVGTDSFYTWPGSG